jgi:hypothetical protein
MSDKINTQDELIEQTPGNLSGDAREDEVEKTGTVSSRHGRINWWLWAVYVIMLVWAVYYALEYWSLPGYNDLGPGLGDY